MATMLRAGEVGQPKRSPDTGLVMGVAKATSDITMNVRLYKYVTVYFLQLSLHTK